ncbi:uncharacterized protein LOC110036940 [Phalaenopsis equestris]|uniref:uncharacterized protein LOC110036940 n=1 Tax=Phalaenopsis equestris TaxID=78828 RepID=UPI0009E277B9|nr:uncharacterized protein LOC110036940 [Phalaenopsis equestris]
MMSSSGASKQRFEISNKYGEKLVGVLHSTGSKNLVILCHGFHASKDDIQFINIISALTREGISALHFDFSGNGESEGELKFGDFRKEADDLLAMVLYFSEKNFKICAICGLSKGGNVVLFYASMHNDAPLIINVSGCFTLKRGLEGRLGKDFIQRIKKDGFIDVMDKAGKVDYRVNEASLMDYLATDMRAVCLAIDKKCRICTVHGSADTDVPLEDAYEFDKSISNHKLHIVEGADHCYLAHLEQLGSSVVDLIKSAQVLDAPAAPLT